MTQDNLLDVSNPRAMRALAHPLRLRMLRLLRQAGPATATTLAAACGESTGATSFHLRQLAKYGFIEEVTDRGMRRERWWQARGQVLEQNAETLANYLDAESAFEPAWRDAALFASATAHLTVDEMNSLNAQMLEMLRAYERPDVTQRPVDARRVRFTIYGVPE